MPADILQEALDLVTGDRNTRYGPTEENHQNIADLWAAYLKRLEGSLSAADVANMMELLKIARRKTGELNRDDFVDGAGYAAVAYACAVAETETEKGKQLELDYSPDHENIKWAVFWAQRKENQRLISGLRHMRSVALASEGMAFYVMLVDQILEGKDWS